MTRFLLLASSFAPLLVIFAVRLEAEHWQIAIALAVLSLISLLCLPIVLKVRRRTAAQPFRVLELRDESQQVPVYLITYIFPLVFASIDGWQALVGFAIFGLLLVVLLLRTDLAMVNPFLLVVGIRIYTVRTSSGADIVLLAERRPFIGQDLTATRLSGSTYRLKQFIE